MSFAWGQRRSRVIVRQCRRFKLLEPLGVTIEARGQSVAGELVEMSAYGAFVRMPIRLWNRERVTIHFDLPGVPDSQLRFVATSVWCNRPPVLFARGLPEGCGLEWVRERSVLLNALAAIRRLRDSGLLAAPSRGGAEAAARRELSGG